MSASTIRPAERKDEERNGHPMNAIDILKYGQQTVLHTIDGFPDSAWKPQVRAAPGR